jgi:hypothetical protein
MADLLVRRACPKFGLAFPVTHCVALSITELVKSFPVALTRDFDTDDSERAEPVVVVHVLAD